MFFFSDLLGSPLLYWLRKTVIVEYGSNLDADEGDGAEKEVVDGSEDVGGASVGAVVFPLLYIGVYIVYIGVYIGVS